MALTNEKYEEFKKYYTDFKTKSDDYQTAKDNVNKTIKNLLNVVGQKFDEKINSFLEYMEKNYPIESGGFAYFIKNGERYYYNELIDAEAKKYFGSLYEFILLRLIHNHEEKRKESEKKGSMKYRHYDLVDIFFTLEKNGYISEKSYKDFVSFGTDYRTKQYLVCEMQDKLTTYQRNFIDSKINKEKYFSDFKKNEEEAFVQLNNEYNDIIKNHIKSKKQYDEKIKKVFENHFPKDKDDDYKLIWCENMLSSNSLSDEMKKELDFGSTETKKYFEIEDKINKIFSKTDLVYISYSDREDDSFYDFFDVDNAMQKIKNIDTENIDKIFDIVNGNIKDEKINLKYVKDIEKTVFSLKLYKKYLDMNKKKLSNKTITEKEIILKFSSHIKEQLQKYDFDFQGKELMDSEKFNELYDRFRKNIFEAFSDYNLYMTAEIDKLVNKEKTEIENKMTEELCFMV